MERKMKLCGISDMHGNYDFVIDPCDIVLICGDVTPLDIQRNDTRSEMWFKTFFIPWCTNLPCEKVVFIGGNHDFILMKHPEIIRDMLKDQDKVIYLDCESYEYKGKVIYGTPLCKKFYNWAFMTLNLDEQRDLYERHLKAIGKIDIIMSHDCPYGINDIILQKDCLWADGSHIGNKALRWFIDEAKPELWLEGHLHTCEHNKMTHNGTAVYNVSLLNEDYKLTYDPLYIEI